MHITDSLLARDEPLLGRFCDSLRHIDGQQDVGRDAFGRPRSALARQLGYKQFQYFGGMSARFIFGCALVDLGYLNSVFVYVVDTTTGETFKRSLRRPGHWGMTLAGNPVEGISVFSGGGVEVRQAYHADPREKSLLVRVGDQLRIEAVMPVVVAMPRSTTMRRSAT